MGAVAACAELAVDPIYYRPPPDAGPEEFHGFKTLGRAAIADAAEQRRLVELVYQGVGESNDSVASCFNPRHGISAEKGGRSVDLLICYECLSLKVFSASEKGETILTARAVEKEISALFAARGLKIAGRG